MFTILKKVFGNKEIVEFHEYKEFDDKTTFILKNRLNYRIEISPMKLISFIKYLEGKSDSYLPNKAEIMKFFDEDVSLYSCYTVPKKVSFTLRSGLKAINIKCQNRVISIGDFQIHKSILEPSEYIVYNIQLRDRIVFKVLDYIYTRESKDKILKRIRYEQDSTEFDYFVMTSLNTLKLNEFDDVESLRSFLSCKNEFDIDSDTSY